ncbi:hypothetical protein VP01_800g3 [Puccinia sorghi]|uniref:Uncharacterized protein n=1 Tax=Puccinia sorghi TaxID=27349 RepID=A0A0L6UAG7_9BASI|nr:hypothetical protein VP01_800g3 [Puccinia sorghi]
MKRKNEQRRDIKRNGGNTFLKDDKAKTSSTYEIFLLILKSIPKVCETSARFIQNWCRFLILGNFYILRSKRESNIERIFFSLFETYLRSFLILFYFFCIFMASCFGFHQKIDLFMPMLQVEFLFLNSRFQDIKVIWKFFYNLFTVEVTVRVKSFRKSSESTLIIPSETFREWFGAELIILMWFVEIKKVLKTLEVTKSEFRGGNWQFEGFSVTLVRIHNEELCMISIYLTNSNLRITRNLLLLAFSEMLTRIKMASLFEKIFCLSLFCIYSSFSFQSSESHTNLHIYEYKFLNSIRIFWSLEKEATSRGLMERLRLTFIGILFKLRNKCQIKINRIKFNLCDGKSQSARIGKIAGLISLQYDYVYQNDIAQFIFSNLTIIPTYSTQTSRCFGARLLCIFEIMGHKL